MLLRFKQKFKQEAVLQERPGTMLELAIKELKALPLERQDAKAEPTLQRFQQLLAAKSTEMSWVSGV